MGVSDTTEADWEEHYKEEIQMAIPDINHKVCVMCDHYNEDDCPYCGMGFEGFSIGKHDIEVRAKARKQGRQDAIDEFAKMIHKDLYQLNHHQVDFLAEQLKEGAE